MNPRWRRRESERPSAERIPAKPSARKSSDAQVDDRCSGVPAARRDGRIRNRPGASARSEALLCADVIVAARRSITPGPGDGYSGGRNISRPAVRVARGELGIRASAHRVACRFPRPPSSAGAAGFPGQGCSPRRRTHQIRRRLGADPSPALHAVPKGGLLGDGLSGAHEQLARTPRETRRWSARSRRPGPREGGTR